MEEKRGTTEDRASAGDPSDQSAERSSASENNAADPRRNRLKLFNKVMEKSLQRLIADASFHRFAKTFHPFYKQNPQLTESIHKQFISQLQTAIQDDIAQIMEEGNLHCKLEELDLLEAAAKESTDPAWRPSGAPERDLCSFVVPYYQQQRQYLRRELKKLRKENAALAQRVLAGRDRISQSEQRIAADVAEWRASSSILEAIGSLSPSQNFDHL
ncbi:polyamine-modulated factor 1 [Paramormyrops kingsleyae]|uniref:polyamine-modulated factor 1 n=1 Tax=Paramormyrops kingsleyae TaxID=1676925 RepID=UPI000CD5CE01|nr:polyamine-modulated factor 1-like [Paramormyrops kingsleyae]